MGDAIGANKVYFKDYADVEVASVGSDGGADFNSLILDTPLAVAEGGTGAGTLSSANLSDVASIAMLDENETVTGYWWFEKITIALDVDVPSTCPQLNIERGRDGEPSWDVSSEDYLGEIRFRGYHTILERGAIIRAVVDGAPGANDMPGRLEFLTTPDDSFTPVLRLAIDNAGNIKMGDGVWTDYVNVTNAGVMTFEGTANIEGVDATELGYVDGVTEDIQTALDTILANVVEDTTPELGGEMDAGAHSIGFTVQTITSTAGTATINWGNSNKARITLSENTTLAFTDPANSGNYLLIIIQPAGDNAYTTTFPAGIYWANSTKVSVPTANLNRCIVSFAFDDEDASDVWYCQGTETFATDD